MEKLLDYLKDTFGDTTKGPQWGAIAGTGLVAVFGAFLGKWFGGGGIIATTLGAVAAGVGAIFFGEQLNEFWDSKIKPSSSPAVMPRAPQPERNLSSQHTLQVENTSGQKATAVAAPVPDIKKFEAVSTSPRGIGVEIIEKRNKADALPIGDPQHAGAVNAHDEQQRKAFQLLANSEAWDKLAN